MLVNNLNKNVSHSFGKNFLAEMLVNNLNKNVSHSFGKNF